MKREIYNGHCRKVADGVVIKENCTSYEITKFGVELLTRYADRNFRYSDLGSYFFKFKEFINKVTHIYLYKDDPPLYITWVTKSHHVVSVFRNKKNGLYDILIGDDESNVFYPLIIEAANNAIFHDLESELPIDFPKKEHYKFKDISRTLVMEYIKSDELLVCEYKGRRYYIYDENTISRTTLGMLQYGNWYIYTEE